MPVTPLDQLGEHPVRRGRVVLVARARLPVAAPLREARRAAARGRPTRAAPNGARGKPDVCSITCSTVIDVLAVRRELGDDLGDAARRRRSRPRRSGSTPRDATIGLRRREDHVARVRRGVAERAPTPRPGRRARTRAGTTGGCPRRRRPDAHATNAREGRLVDSELGRIGHGDGIDAGHTRSVQADERVCSRLAAGAAGTDEKGPWVSTRHPISRRSRQAPACAGRRRGSTGSTQQWLPIGGAGAVHPGCSMNTRSTGEDPRL